MASRTVLRLHIGLPKSGSTSLQRALASSATVTFLGKGEAHWFAEERLRAFVRRVAPYRQPSAEEAAEVRASLARAWADGPAILSDEVLSGIGFSAEGRGQDVVDIVRAVASVVDVPIEVLLVVRQPMALLRSYHAQMVTQGSDLGFSGLLALILLRPDAWIARTLDPDAWVDALPVRAVHILPFEQLFGDPACSAALFERLDAADAHRRFLTLHKNPRVTDDQLRALLAAEREPGSRGADWRMAFSVADVERAAVHAGVDPERLWSAMAPATAGDRPSDPLRPDPVLLAAVERHLGACHQRLARRLPEYDWAGHGYPVEEPVSS